MHGSTDMMYAWRTASSRADRRERDPVVAMPLLVLDVQRPRLESEHFGRGQQRISLLRVVVEEQLEPGELHGLRLHVVVIRIELEPGRAPPLPVHHDLHV